MPGHIVKRGKNSWTVVVDLGRDPTTGERKQLWRSVKGTKRDAEAFLVGLLHERDTGIDIQPGRITLSKFLERWLKDYARVNTAPKTFIRYEEIARLHLVPSLGSIRLIKLRPPHIQQAYSKLLGKGLSSRTVLHCHRVLREALQHAVQWQLLARNPADAVQPPRPERSEVRALEAEEARQLLQAVARTRYDALVHLAVTSGMRKGELLGLRWSDVDLDAGVLHVQQTCQWLPHQGFVFRQPKTQLSRRAVALSPEAVRRLHQHRQRQLEERLAVGSAYQDNGLVFTTPLGAPIDPSNFRRAWERIVREAGLGHVRFHDLRHTHATLLLQQGVHPKIVSERLGHAGVAITMDTYSHVLPSLQAKAAVGFDRLLEGVTSEVG